MYCSCRCADINGTQSSGGTFCNCPDGFSCTQLVPSSGAADQGLTGAYCIKSGTEFDSSGGASTCTTCGGVNGLNCGPATNTGGT